MKHLSHHRVQTLTTFENLWDVLEKAWVIHTGFGEKGLNVVMLQKVVEELKVLQRNVRAWLFLDRQRILTMIAGAAGY